MSKRKNEEIQNYDEYLESSKRKKPDEHVKKHTLDSDEEDSGAEDERYNILDENEILGEEDGVAGMDGEVKITPFNMKEELEEGHFDGDGHFQWKKSKEIKDHWLDNLDWVKIKEKKTTGENDSEQKSNDNSSDSDDDDSGNDKKFDVFETYRSILELMVPNETIKAALQRLGKKIEKVSTQERFRRKKLGIVDANAEKVTKLTELSNLVLTKLGNMDVYDETYEEIQQKYGSKLKGGSILDGPSSSTAADNDDMLDMYADDFDTKEKDSIKVKDLPGVNTETATTSNYVSNNQICWEFKWKETDTDIYGPYNTEQMQKWVTDGYFKDGVLVRKSGSDAPFYTSNRVDFELYL